MNARGARADNHCETQGIHRFIEKMSPKHLERQENRERSRGADESRSQTQAIHMFSIKNVTPTFGKVINARGARGLDHCQT